MLDCNYSIPAEQNRIDPQIIIKWAEKATQQSFDLDYNTIEQQLANLSACYTKEGWKGFNQALQHSGNFNAIKSQQLTVNSTIDGNTQLTELKNNEWKLVLALQVVYQNDKDKLTQLLTVNLTVRREISGKLGIVQMIASPREPSIFHVNGVQQPTSESQQGNNLSPRATTSGAIPR